MICKPSTRSGIDPITFATYSRTFFARLQGGEDLQWEAMHEWLDNNSASTKILDMDYPWMHIGIDEGLVEEFTSTFVTKQD